MADDPTYQELLEKIRQLEDTERLLKEKTERLELAIDAAEDGVWDLDPRTGQTYFSPRWLTMLGYQPGELPGAYETWANLLHPEDRVDAERAVQRFLTNPDTLFSIEFRMRTKDGDWRWIHSRGKSIARDQDGKISRMIGTHVDITERRRLEESLRLTQFIYEKASIGIFRVGSDARIIGVNDAAAKSLGYSREELTSLRIFDIDPMNREDNWGVIWQRLLDGGGDRFETVHRHKNGTKIPVLITSSLLEYKGQQFSIAFVQDISQTKRMEQALFQAQKMEAIGNLAGGIAHDFNNILSAIYGYAQLAQLKMDDIAKVQECIGNVCVASERAKALVMQILAFSRHGNSEKYPIDIGAIVKEALKLLRASIPATIAIQDSVTLGGGPVAANQTQIHQVVMNLCTNSAHSLRSGGGKIVVELYPFVVDFGNASEYQDIAPGKYLKLVVADNGHGIAPEVLPRIFEPYFTTKDLGEGTGMGLATVHGIVKDHGGSIKVYSELGTGTTFQVLFPVAADVLSPVGERIHVLPEGSERILLIDDEQFIVDIGKEVLTSLGYRVTTKKNARDALEVFRYHSGEYDLIITDFAMPQMDGEQLVTEIRKIRPNIPIILCTGFATGIVSQKMSSLGIDAILMKPVSTFELANAVRQAIDARCNLRRPGGFRRRGKD
ncbi:MAG: PAS domain S-box protein [Desulforhopalus sp.]|nr:PAS domain S-box protein [Desulforhopalus sp.]